MTTTTAATLDHLIAYQQVTGVVAEIAPEPFPANSRPSPFPQVLSRALKLFTLILVLTGIASCAIAGGEPRMYFHSFSFDLAADAKKYGHSEVDVLDYAYGDSGVPRTRPSKVAREMSDVFNNTSITGAMPRGEFLYVKWRIKATGEIHEDRVDLRNRLPTDMTNYGVHFLIDGAQLYVFLLPPEEMKDSLGRVSVVTGGWTRDIYYLDRYADYRSQHQIYPDKK
jgi:hypothetical protein